MSKERPVEAGFLAERITLAIAAQLREWPRSRPDEWWRTPRGIREDLMKMAEELSYVGKRLAGPARKDGPAS